MMTMEVWNERIFSSPFPIIDGKITIEIPEWNLRIVAPVVQVKGQGTHDAKHLAGKPLDEWHLRIIRKMKQHEEISTEDLRIQIVKDLHFSGETAHTKQSFFQRKHSELLYFGIIHKSSMNGHTPMYSIDECKGFKALDSGVFPLGK